LVANTKGGCDVNLSKLERLKLINQFKILEQLYPGEADHYKNQRTVLEWGYTRHYSDMFHWIADEMSEEECNEIVEILELHRVLYDAYQKLKDKKGINPEDIQFKGFDGNNESKEMLYATFYMHELDGYRELRGSGQSPDYNSHHPMIEKYRSMVKVWSGKAKSRQLGKEDIVDIIQA
jgi:uncharacterized protein